jgi:hypothetical protein
MNAVMVYANVSATDLRTRGVPEQVVQFVEHNRAHLQRTIQQQQVFRGMVQKPNVPGQAPDPGRMNPDVLGSFSGMLPQPQAGSLPPAGARQQQQPQQGHPSTGMTTNGTNSGNGQSQPPQKPPPINAMPSIQASRPSRPTLEQSQEAIQFIHRVKNDFVLKSEYFELLNSLALLTPSRSAPHEAAPCAGDSAGGI